VCEYTEQDEYGEWVLREDDKARLYDDSNIDYELSQIVGDIVYKCWDYLFQYIVSDSVRLVARPNGVTGDGSTVVMVGADEDTLMATMGVCKAQKGVSIGNEVLTLEFDEFKWEEIIGMLHTDN
jgi:hypothetical protein